MTIQRSVTYWQARGFPLRSKGTNDPGTETRKNCFYWLLRGLKFQNRSKS